MRRYLVRAVLCCLLTFYPAISHAAFLNYSGTLPNASAKFSTFNVGTGRFDEVMLKAHVDGGVTNIGLMFDPVLGQLTGPGDSSSNAKALFGNATVLLRSVNLLPAGGGKYIGNCFVQIEFYTGSVTHDPATGLYSGTGQVYVMQGGSQALAMGAAGKKKGLLKVNKVMPNLAEVRNVTNGVVADSFTPALVKSISLPAINMEIVPVP